ncbi:PD-(D/E)XK nuclease family protein [Haliscomenobacter sp.]|uniref:PD-(D/E)XK nuclease family protein n=1 Tax=Haliscomenobacter sp. TaxID=2717303 RepID=UPI0035937C78
MNNSSILEKPNLFKHATSELSQDAILAWLIRWADPLYAQADPQLHEVGHFFVQKLYEKAGKEVPPFTKLKVITQKDKIDILVELICTDDTTRYILLEDKVNANEHGDQLDRYIEKLTELREIEEANILPILLKTSFHTESPSNEKYTLFTLFDLYEVWQTGSSKNIHNAIFTDYGLHLEQKHLKYLQAQFDYQNYTTIPVKGWSYWHWKGFFTHLKAKFQEGSKIHDQQNAHQRQLVFNAPKVSVTNISNQHEYEPYLDLGWLEANNLATFSLSVRVRLKKDTEGFDKNFRDVLAAELQKQDLYRGGVKAKFKRAKQTICLLKLKLNTDIYDDAAKLGAHLLELNEQLHRLPATIDPINRT